ncbi:MAG: peptidylprolyl isomerase [Hyphomonadaceae bacterium]|nr:MAG: peptidylprolyl isomerase [Caulobacteraceae bacterium]MBT9445275.1 peptidylprolyl isomerase [Hyphomonadaceae bacterium]TPW07784.1 MAG: peptidylprolyl isomerase [Alphaproteobacteria bacterium]
MKRFLTVAAALGLAACATAPAAPVATAPKTTAEILAASPAADWRTLDLPATLVMTLAGGRTVVIELNTTFAPKTAANILTLARQQYFDGLAVLRVQDNFVTQWGDPDGETDHPKPLGAAAARIPAEFSRDRAAGPFVKLPDGDGFAPEVGFVGGFPVARDRNAAWLTHCYAMVGAGRNNDPDSGPGSELYVVIGHSPRQLDRNITLVGRVVQGMEHLAALPRGTGPLGFYEQPAQRTAIESLRIASELPSGGAAGRLEALSTTSATFTALIEARRNRRDDWYKVPAGHIDLCSVPLPVRAKP